MHPKHSKQQLHSFKQDGYYLRCKVLKHHISNVVCSKKKKSNMCKHMHIKQDSILSG